LEKERSSFEAEDAVAEPEVPSPDRKVASGNFFMKASPCFAADDDFVLLQAVNRCLLAATSPT